MTLRKKDTNNVAILLKHKNDIKLVYINGYKKHYYFVLASVMVDCKKQILITGIKTNI